MYLELLLSQHFFKSPSQQKFQDFRNQREKFQKFEKISAFGF